MKVPPESNELRRRVFSSFPPDLYPFQREFYFNASVRDLFKTVIEDNAEDVRSLLDFSPKPYILSRPLTFNRGLEEPLIFEDLCHDGYRVWNDEFNGLDIPHAVVALEAYGKLHALGMCLLEKRKVREGTIEKLFNFKPALSCILFEFVDNGLKDCQDWIIKNNYPKETVEKIEYAIKERNYLKIVDKMYEDGKSHEIQVVQHFDARTSNMLFNYASDNSTPVSAKLVDFQFSSFSPPFWDLTYFLALSISSENLIPNYQHLIERLSETFYPKSYDFPNLRYHESLTSTLTRLNYPKPIPTRSYITNNIQHFSPMVFPLIAGITSAICKGTEDALLREKKIKSSVENCGFFGMFENTSIQRE